MALRNSMFSPANIDELNERNFSADHLMKELKKRVAIGGSLMLVGAIVILSAMNITANKTMSHEEAAAFRNTHRELMESIFCIGFAGAWALIFAGIFAVADFFGAPSVNNIEQQRTNDSDHEAPKFH